MALLKRKADPISDRARALNAQIASLESEIKQLNTKISTSEPAHPKVRSTALPHTSSAATHPKSSAVPNEPIFESVSPPKPVEEGDEIGRYNQRGVRKFDLIGLWSKIQRWFKGPSTTNPKLVNYLAAGSIKGLRPLRYEKRVARNRFIALSIFFLLLLWGILAVLFKNR